jgi:hypothetical protein
MAPPARRLALPSRYIATPVKDNEEALDQRVFYRLAARIGLQIALCDVSFVPLTMHQNPVPGAVPRGSGTRNLFIPLVASLEGQIYVSDDASIVEQPVVHQLSDIKLDAGSSHSVQSLCNASRSAQAPLH